jgi:pilus assembly protein Flp/PilA
MAHQAWWIPRGLDTDVSWLMLLVRLGYPVQPNGWHLSVSRTRRLRRWFAIRQGNNRLWENHMLEFIRNIHRNIQAKRNEDGASAVEYGLLVAAIAALIVIIIFSLGGIVKESFSDTCTAIKSGAGTSMAATCGA